MRGRCGAPDLAPPALEGSRSDETPVHAPDIGRFARAGYLFPVLEPARPPAH